MTYIDSGVRFSHEDLDEITEYLNDLSLYIHCYQCSQLALYKRKIELSSIYISRILNIYTPHMNDLELVLIKFIDMFDEIDVSKVKASLELLDGVIKDALVVFDFYTINEMQSANVHTVYLPTVQAIHQVIASISDSDSLEDGGIDFF